MFDKIIVKMDIEGAEVDLLEALLEKNTINLISVRYVEFHSQYQSMEHSLSTRKREDDIINRITNDTNVKIRIWHCSKRVNGTTTKISHPTTSVSCYKNELKAEMKAIQQQMIEAKKSERANALKEVKRLCKEFGFAAGMLKVPLAEGRCKA